MKAINQISLFTSFFVALVTSVHAISITNFGSSSYTLDGGLTTIGTSQNANSIDLSGSDLATQLSGTISLTDTSSLFGNDLLVTGSVTTDPGSTFTIVLVDSNFFEASFSGGSWSEIQSTGSTLLTAGSVDAGFNAANVGFVDLFFQGAGASVGVNLNGLSIVPEPSAFALLAGCFGMAWVMVRRRA